MSFPHGETVILHRPTAGVEDRWSNIQPGVPEETEIRGVAIWQVSADELLAGQDLNTTRYRLVFREPVNVLATDELEFRGDVFAVDGDSALNHNPFTGTEVVQVDAIARK